MTCNPLKWLMRERRFGAARTSISALAHTASPPLEAGQIRPFPAAFAATAAGKTPAAKAPAAKKTAAKKAAPAKKAPAAKKAAATKAPRKPGAGLAPSAALAAVIGDGAVARTEVIKKLWDYIKANGLQDATNKRAINADAKLLAVFGKPQVTMFELAGIVGKHLG